MQRDDLYPKYHRLVGDICRRYLKKLPDEELCDLTQSCWEAIIREHPKYDETRGELSTWITLLCRSTLANMIRDMYTDKRSNVDKRHPAKLKIVKNVSYEDFIGSLGER